MLFSVIALSAIVSAASRCPTGLIKYRKKCLDCDIKSGPICSTTGAVFTNECALVYKNQLESFAYDYDVATNTCVKVSCDGVISNPICATGGVIYDNFYLMDAAGAFEDPNLLYDSISKTCIAVEGQNPSN